MQKMRRDAIRYAQDAGVTNLFIEERGKHVHLRGTLAGRPFLFRMSLGANAAARNYMRTYIAQTVRRHQERA
jgi:hypothetical protein